MASPSTSSALRRDLNGGFVPLPTQAAFLSSPVRHKFFVGPMGCGKSVVGARHMLTCCASVPGNTWVVGRYNKTDFDRTTRVTIDQMLAAAPEFVEAEIPGRGGWKIRTIDPDRPSTIWVMHFDESGPYTSMDLGGAFIDEINGSELSAPVPVEVWRIVASRITRLKHVPRPFFLCTGMPLGHNAYWRMAAPASSERRDDCAWFKPQPWENSANLREGYYEDLLKHGAEWAARYVYGSDEVFEGQVYGELSEAKDCVDPFPIPPEWPRGISLDHGLRNPTAVGFFAIGWDGEMYLYDEHYEAGQPIPYHAEKIKQRLPAMKKAREITWIADPSIFNKTMQRAGKTYSVFDEYAECGLDQWGPGENDIAAGRNRVKVALSQGKLKFFRGRVPNAWREMTQLHWKRLRSLQDRDAPEQEADIDNHCLHGDTLVVTPEGEVPIRDLAGTDGTVLSPTGEWASYRNARLTQRMVPTVRVRFDDGRVVRCTPDHQFMVSDGSWVPAKALTGLAVCNSIPHRIKESGCESPLSARPSKSSKGNGTTSWENTSAASSIGVGTSVFIGSSGNGLTDRFRRVTTFITSMGTGRITSQRILPSLNPRDTASSIAASAARWASRISTMPSPRLLRGMRALPVAAGIGSSIENPAASFCIGVSPRSATSAEPLSRASLMRGSARIAASRLGVALKGWTRRAGTALSAAPPTRSIDTASREPALAPAPENLAAKYARVESVSEAGSSDVYCLTVPGVDAFCVEGGIVVANSPDYIRYFLMTRPEPADRPATVEAPKSPGRRLGDRAAKAYRQAVKQRQREQEGDGDSYV